MSRLTVLLAVLAGCLSGPAFAGPEKAGAASPTLADVPYGPDKRRVLDFWKAGSGGPAPAVIYFHGGGWYDGDKTLLRQEPDRLATLLAAGISVVAVNYRFVAHAEAEHISPPVRVPLHDAARALQFVRSKAADWNIDKARIAASGGSAGACTALWLAFHDDLADPKSEDPVARESTRLWCAAVSNAQTSLDPQQMRDWTPNIQYGAHAFGFRADPARGRSDFDVFLENRPRILAWIEEYSPYALASRGDPPVYIYYSNLPAVGHAHQDATHAANFGVKLRERCALLGVEVRLAFPGMPDSRYPSGDAFLIERLKAGGDQTRPGRGCETSR